MGFFDKLNKYIKENINQRAEGSVINVKNKDKVSIIFNKNNKVMGLLESLDEQVGKLFADNYLCNIVDKYLEKNDAEFLYLFCLPKLMGYENCVIDMNANDFFNNHNLLYINNTYLTLRNLIETRADAGVCFFLAYLIEQNMDVDDNNSYDRIEDEIAFYLEKGIKVLEFSDKDDAVDYILEFLLDELDSRPKYLYDALKESNKINCSELAFYNFVNERYYSKLKNTFNDICEIVSISSEETNEQILQKLGQVYDLGRLKVVLIIRDKINHINSISILLTKSDYYQNLVDEYSAKQMRAKYLTDLGKPVENEKIAPGNLTARKMETKFILDELENNIYEYYDIDDIDLMTGGRI